MTDSNDTSLSELAAKLEAHVKELRRQGNHSDLLAAAMKAADEVEARAPGSSANEREALTRVRRFTYNAAADLWPGWGEPGTPSDAQSLQGALALAQRSADLGARLGLGELQQATGIWLVGAFELALGRYAEALRTFASAREHYVAGKAPGLTLLTDGYSAIARELAGPDALRGADGLDDVCAKINAGAFEDGAEWIQQLRTARTAFAR